MTSLIDPQQVSHLVDVARVVALDAGALLQRSHSGLVQVRDTKSSSVDVVTDVDHASEELIRRLLSTTRPHDAVLGEEGEDRPGDSGLTWVVDPIDGTTNYLYGIPQYSVSIAVVTGDPRIPGAWQPIAGCVHNPATNETWSAGCGTYGSWLQGHRLTLKEPTELDHVLLGTGFSYVSDKRQAQGEVVARLLPQVRDIRRMGSAALDLCAVASNRLDAYYESDLNVWDLAAGLLIAEQAGAVVRGFGDNPPSRDMVLAGSPQLVDRLETLITDAMDVSEAGTGAAGAHTPPRRQHDTDAT